MGHLNVEKYKVGSLYAGVGGICKGFINGGAEVLWANEFDSKACQTYRANFKHTLYEGDVWKLNPSELPRVDILAGGFPCQPFSIAGHRLGFSDSRGNHFFRIIDFIRGLDYPKAIFLENVKNLKTHDDGRTFSTIEKLLKEEGYSIVSRVMNTKDYGNIPQNRERIFIVGFKDDEDGCNQYLKYFFFPNEIPLTTSIADILDENVDEKYIYTKEKTSLYDAISEGMSEEGVICQWRRKYIRANKKGLCPTLTANMGTGGHNVPLVKTKQGIRKLTPRECFRLQGFDDGYIFPEGVSDSCLYKQSGNSVSVPVIERIARNMIKALNHEFCEEIVQKPLF